MRNQQRLTPGLTLAERDVYYYRGLQQPGPMSIYQFYEQVDVEAKIKPLVLTLEEDFEFCEALDLIFGKQPKRMTLWDWFNEAWDQLNDRRHGYSLDQVLAGCVCDRYDLEQLFRRPNEVEWVRKTEMERRERLKEPQAFIDPKHLMEFF